MLIQSTHTDQYSILTHAVPSKILINTIQPDHQSGVEYECSLKVMSDKPQYLDTNLTLLKVKNYQYISVH